MFSVNTYCKKSYSMVLSKPWEFKDLDYYMKKPYKTWPKLKQYAATKYFSIEFVTKGKLKKTSKYKHKSSTYVGGGGKSDAIALIPGLVALSFTAMTFLF